MALCYDYIAENNQNEVIYNDYIESLKISTLISI